MYRVKRKVCRECAGEYSSFISKMELEDAEVPGGWRMAELPTDVLIPTF